MHTQLHINSMKQKFQYSIKLKSLNWNRLNNIQLPSNYYVAVGALM